MDALGLSQRCGDGGKGIGGKCLYRKYLHLMNQVGMMGGGFFFSNANREAYFFSSGIFFLVLHYLFFFFEVCNPGDNCGKFPY